MWVADMSRRGFTIIRRCVEAADVLAAASVEPAAAVVIDIDTPRLSADALAAIPNASKRAIIGVAGNDDGAHCAASWGITRLCRHDEGDVVEQIVAELHAHRPSIDEPVVASGQVHPRGVTAVYGAAGAPGRSTVALGLAEAWARSGDRVCLIDADTVGPSLGVLVGMTEDVSGLLVAARYADQGALDSRSLASSCRRLDDRLWLMTGIGSPDRWSQLRSAPLERVIRTCAEQFDRVVIDTNPLLNVQEIDDAMPGGVTPRDGATHAVLRLSDAVVAVTRPDAVALVRLIGDLPTLLNSVDHTQVSVVVNRAARRGERDLAHVREALSETGIHVSIHALPEDASVAMCRRTGSLLAEVAASKRLRKSLSRVSVAVAA
jgi:MinD-like ATPase involved in chromosome partitioning or flagellar assembly